MRLTTDTILRAVARTLREQVTPAVADPYVVDVLRMAANQVAMAAETWDDAAALRVAENASLRALFADALAVTADPALAARLRKAAASCDPGLRLHELDAENGRLREALVALHAHTEALEGAEARALEARIWTLLQAIEASRAPRA